MWSLRRKTVASKTKASKSGRWLPEAWGQCLDRVRHPTAQAERIHWRPHLEAFQVGYSKSKNALYLTQSSSESQTLLDCWSAAEGRVYHVVHYDRE